MNDFISNGYAERVPKEEINLNNGHKWYIPHHGVYHLRSQENFELILMAAQNS